MKLLVLTAIAALCAAATPSEKTHYYVVEYQRAPRAGVPQLDVTFFVEVTPDRAMAVLKREMLAAAEFEKPAADVLVTAWDGRGKAAGDEEQIALPGDVRQLIYVAKTGEVKPFRP